MEVDKPREGPHGPHSRLHAAQGGPVSAALPPPPPLPMPRPKGTLKRPRSVLRQPKHGFVEAGTQTPLPDQFEGSFTFFINGMACVLDTAGPQPQEDASSSSPVAASSTADRKDTCRWAAQRFLPAHVLLYDMERRWLLLPDAADGCVTVCRGRQYKTVRFIGEHLVVAGRLSVDDFIVPSIPRRSTRAKDPTRSSAVRPHLHDGPHASAFSEFIRSQPHGSCAATLVQQWNSMTDAERAPFDAAATQQRNHTAAGAATSQTVRGSQVIRTPRDAQQARLSYGTPFSARSTQLFTPFSQEADDD